MGLIWVFLGDVLGSCEAVLGGPWGSLRPSWGPLGRLEGLLGPSCCRLGAVWGRRGALEGHLGPLRRPSWASLLSWDRLGPPRALWRRLEVVLEASWVILGPSWAVLGLSWRLLGLS